MIIYNREAKTPKTPFVRHNADPAQFNYDVDTGNLF